MSRSSLDKLALAARDRLREEPTLRLNLLASALDAQVDDMYTVLDEYAPTTDGVEHVGPGKGGPWIEPREPRRD